MNIKKVFSYEMERCYSVTSMDIDSVPHAFFATEGRDGGCIAVNCNDYKDVKQILSGPGGTMGMVKVPGKENEFVTGIKFYSLANWDEAAVAWASRQENGEYHLSELFATPYLHRFDIVVHNGIKWFVGCVLAAHKETKEDFSQSGSVFVAKLPDKAGEKLEPVVLCTGFYRNHGYERIKWNGCDSGMVSCDSGVYVLTPPEEETGKWTVEQIMDQPTSDIAAIDIDEDGEYEIATIEAFHGSFFRIYKKIEGKYEKVFEHPEVTEFYHVASSGRINERPVFVGGCRRGKQQLFLVAWNNNDGKFEVITVDENVGPSNAMIVKVQEKNLLIVANRETAEAAIYDISL